MIKLTLSEDTGEVFINPNKIIGVVENDDGFTDVMCDSQFIVSVKETPEQVVNIINNQFN